MSEPLTVYTVVPPNHTASWYYRVQVPLMTAQDLGLPVRAMIDNESPSISGEDRVKVFTESDVVLLYQPTGEHSIHNFKGLQSLVPSKRDGEWKWAPSVVIESDDNLFNVSPLNHAYKTLGIRDMNGEAIPVGHHIGIVEGGERKVLWKDGDNGFSIARNRQTIETWRTILNMADLVSCSTEGVEAALRKETVPRRTRVFPNLVRFDHYEQVDLAPKKQIRILWQGGSAHYEDWYPLREALGNITRRYPEVFWVMWGVHFHWVTGLIPPERYEFKPWCPYPEYKLRLAMIGHDINLAPLSANRFNDCRSAIKFYESTVLKKPAVTLAQKTAAYAREMKDGETGMLFSTPQEFEEKLARLIENEQERRTLAANAKQWVSENRDAMKKVPEMVATWEELREERKIEQPHVTDEEWAEIEKEVQAEEAELQPA